MIILIGGSTHTGKTTLAQRLLERYSFPYLSLDHLKMGMIRGGFTHLTVNDDDEMTDFLWPAVRGIIMTAVENRQNLVIEGCYIKYDWKSDFDKQYLNEIRCCYLIMSSDYINSHFDDILAHAGVTEHRINDGSLTRDTLLASNSHTLDMCRKFGCEYILIDGDYNVTPDSLHL